MRQEIKLSRQQREMVEKVSKGPPYLGIALVLTWNQKRTRDSLEDIGFFARHPFAVDRRLEAHRMLTPACRAWLATDAMPEPETVAERVASEQLRMI